MDPHKSQAQDIGGGGSQSKPISRMRCLGGGDGIAVCGEVDLGIGVESEAAVGLRVEGFLRIGLTSA